MFEEREKLVFSLLEELGKKFEFVVIGGYAVNAYALPRFSVDCDIVIKEKKSFEGFQDCLAKKGFKKKAHGTIASFNGEFVSFVLVNDAKATFDIFFNAIEDRMSGIAFPAKLFFDFSSKRIIFGKSGPMQLRIRVVDSELLFLMKSISCRTTDIRDVFMLASTKLNRQKLLKISKTTRLPKESKTKIIETLQSIDFKNSLQGVFGKIPEQQFEAAKKKLLSLFEMVDC